MILAIYIIVMYGFIKKNNMRSARLIHAYIAVFASILFLALRDKAGILIYGIKDSNLAMLIFSIIVGLLITIDIDKIENDTKLSLNSFKARIMFLMAILWANLMAAKSFLILLGAITVWPLYIAWLGYKWFGTDEDDYDKGFLVVVAVSAVYVILTNVIARTLNPDGQRIVLFVCVAVTIAICFIGKDKLFKLMCMANPIIFMLAHISVDFVDMQIVALITGIAFCVTLMYRFTYNKLTLLVITVLNLATNIDLLGSILGIK